MRYVWLFGGPANGKRHAVPYTNPHPRVDDWFNVFIAGYGWHVYKIRLVHEPCGEAVYAGERVFK